LPGCRICWRRGVLFGDQAAGPGRFWNRGSFFGGCSYQLLFARGYIVEPLTKSVITIKRSLEEQLSFLAGLWDENCPDADDHVEATEDGGMLLNYRTVHITTRLDPAWKQDWWMIPRIEVFPGQGC